MKLYATEYAKALVAALIGFLSALIPVTDNGLTSTEVLTAVLAGLVALSATYVVPNKPPRGQPARPDVSEQGAVDTNLVAAIAVGVLLAALVLYVLQLAF